MGIDVRIKGIEYEDSVERGIPYYDRSYHLTLELTSISPSVEDVISSEERRSGLVHFVSHNDPQLQQAVDELDEILGDYEPQVFHHDTGNRFSLDSAFARITSSDGRVTQYVKDHHILNAAHKLRAVLRYAIQEREDIEVGRS